MSEKTERQASPIAHVENIAHGRVRVTFENGTSTECRDDGSFWQWTGGQDSRV